MKERLLQWMGQESVKLLFVGLAGLIGWAWSFIATVPMIKEVRAEMRSEMMDVLSERDKSLAVNITTMDNKLDRVILYLCITEKIRDHRICN